MRPQKLAFADANDNKVNDWLEIGSFDEVTGVRDPAQVGRAYAVYQVSHADLDALTDPLQAFFNVPLTTIFNVLRKNGEPVLDDKKELRFDAEGKSIVAGNFQFYIVGANRFGHRGKVSALKTVTMPDVRVSNAPKPLPVLGGAVDLDKAIVPLKWTFPNEGVEADKNALNPKYTDEASDEEIPRYFITVYKEEDGITPKDPDTQKLKFEDNNENDLNDWLELAAFDTQTGLRDQDSAAKAYAVYQVTREELLSFTSEQNTKYFETSLTTIFDSIPDGQGDFVRDGKGELIFAPQGRSVKAGNYDFFVISTNKFEHQSEISDSLRVALEDVAVEKAPKPLISDAVVDMDKKNIGLVPLKWSYDLTDSDLADDFDETNPLAVPYVTEANDSYVPRHFIVVYADDPDLEPLNASTGKIKFEDLNANGINDWVEIGSFSSEIDVSTGEEILIRDQAKAGKAYAVYQVTAKDLESLTLDQQDIFYEIPLTTIYDVIENGGNILERDVSGQLRYQASGRNIVAGSYDFYMVSNNKLDHESDLSAPISVTLPSVTVEVPPVPVAIEVVAGLEATDKEKSIFVERKKNGRVPLSWAFDLSDDDLADGFDPSNPLDDRYVTATDSKYLPRYYIAVYADEAGLLPLDSVTGQIKNEDLNGNDINDWLEIGSFDRTVVDNVNVLTRDVNASGKAYAVYQLTAEQINEFTNNQQDIFYEVPLTTVFDVIDDGQGGLVKDEEGQVRYEGVGQSIVAGDYHFYMISNSRFNLESSLSEGVTVRMTDVEVVDAPKPFVDFPGNAGSAAEQTIFQNKLNVGLVPVHWNFDEAVETNPLNEVYTIEDNADFIPSYFVAVYQADDLINPIDDVTGKLDFVDENNNSINDFLEIKVVDENGDIDTEVPNNMGKAYAVYQISNAEIVNLTQSQEKVFYEIPLVSIYDVVRNVDQSIREDNTGNLIYELRGQNIKAGEYEVYLIASNRFDILGAVSDKVELTLPDVEVQEPPKPTIDEVVESNSDIKIELEQGVVPINWQFLEADEVSPRDDIYTDNSAGTNANFIPSYQVIVFDDINLDPVDPLTNKLAFIDEDQNGLNDWTQIDRGLDGENGKAYASYQVSNSELLETIDQFDVNARLPLIRIFDVARDSVDPTKFLMDDQGELIFEGRGQTLNVGSYFVYIFAQNSFGHNGEVSGQETVVIDTQVVVNEAPQPVIASVDSEIESVQNALNQGIIPLNWTLNVEGPASTDPRDDSYKKETVSDTDINNDFIPYYQIVVYKGLTTNPIENNGRYKFADDNNNNINDYLEIELRETNGTSVVDPSNIGKAYAIYRVLADDILTAPTQAQIDEGILDVMSRIRLTDVFDIKRDASGLVKDEKGDFVFERKGQTVKADTYQIFMTSVNRFEQESLVSGNQNVVFDHDILVVEPPQPNLKPIDEEDPFLEFGRIPLLWDFDGSSPINPRDEIYTNPVKSVVQVDLSTTIEKNENFLPQYQVIVYRKDRGAAAPQDPFDGQGHLLFADENANELNDYLEIDQGDQIGKAYAVYRFNNNELLPAPVPQEGLTTPNDVMYRVPLLRVFDVEPDVSGGLDVMIRMKFNFLEKLSQLK